MELHENIKRLYRHWTDHVEDSYSPIHSSSIESLVPHEILWFIRERIEIWKKKVAGKQPPYTDDPILARFKFCNIFREFDRQTIEFHTLLKSPARGFFFVDLEYILLPHGRPS